MASWLGGLLSICWLVLLLVPLTEMSVYIGLLKTVLAGAERTDFSGIAIRRSTH